MRLSVCMIVKDEERHLPRCLQSLQGVADELCLLDTGSSDATIDLAHAAGARVARRSWDDDFAAARNASLAMASGDWILVLDADEALLGPAPQARAALERFVAQGPQRLGRVCVENRSEGTLQSRSSITRLFPAGGRFRFDGRVHEQLLPTTGSILPVRHADTGLTLSHVGYAQDAIELKGKLERNARLLVLALEDRTQDGYLWFQLGRTRALAKDPAGALEALEQALAHCPDGAPWGILALEEGAYCLRAMEASQQALELLSAVEESHAGRPDTCFLLALLAMDTGDLERAQRGFERCLELGEQPAGPSESARSAATYAPAYNLGVLFEVGGDPARAEARYRQALELQPGHAESLAGLRRLGALETELAGTLGKPGSLR